jgi:microcystin degradation protein MlrC
MGTSFIVVTDADADGAQANADELAAWLSARREDFVGRLVSIDKAVHAARSTPGMSVLLDMGDNVGGGGPGTSTAILAALYAADAGPAVATLFAADAARAAHDIGVGASARFTFTPPSIGEAAFEIAATVAGLFDGRFTESQPRHGGATHFDMGPTAVLVAGPLTLIVTSRRLFPVSQEQYAACGLDVRRFRHVVAKGVHAPIAAYEALAPTFVHVDTPGVTSADLARFDFHRRRRPLFPFEPVAGRAR